MQRLNDLPTVSVIITSKDKRDYLKKAIDSVKALDYPNDKFEIIVVEEGDSPQQIEGVKCVFIPRKKEIDYGYPRNLGVKNARNEIIAFVDDDCIVTKDWLKELAFSFKGDVGGVAGGVLADGCNAIGYCETILGFTGGGLKKVVESKGKVLPTNQLSTCNCAYRKEVFEDIGYFQENTRFSGEDYDFAQRVCRKYKCLYNPNALVYHKAKENLGKIFRWFIRRGICEIYLVRMKTNKFIGYLWYNITRSLTVRFICLFLVLTYIRQNRLSVYLGLCVIYYLMIIFRYRFQWERLRNVKTLLTTPVVKLVMDLGMDWGRIIGPFILLKQVILKR